MSDAKQAREAPFEILEALVGETLRGGSPRLERWLGTARGALGPLAEAGSARERRSAARILEAYELAAELVASLAAEGRS